MESQLIDLPYRCISLIGYRCTGKTTVGRLLAQRLAWEFADADDLVRRRAGKDIADIFRDDGEAAFRQLEEKAIAELVGRAQLVLSVGGGAVLREANVQQLRSAGPVIWLTASADTIAHRLQADQQTARQRPSLTDRGVLDEVAEVLARRRPVYQSAASHTIDTDNRTPSEVVAELIRQLTAGDGPRA